MIAHPHHDEHDEGDGIDARHEDPAGHRSMFSERGIQFASEPDRKTGSRQTDGPFHGREHAPPSRRSMRAVGTPHDRLRRANRARTSAAGLHHRGRRDAEPPAGHHARRAHPRHAAARVDGTPPVGERHRARPPTRSRRDRAERHGRAAADGARHRRCRHGRRRGRRRRGNETRHHDAAGHGFRGAAADARDVPDEAGRHGGPRERRGRVHRVPLDREGTRPARGRAHVRRRSLAGADAPRPPRVEEVQGARDVFWWATSWTATPASCATSSARTCRSATIRGITRSTRRSRTSRRTVCRPRPGHERRPERRGGGPVPVPAAGWQLRRRRAPRGAPGPGCAP